VALEGQNSHFESESTSTSSPGAYL
jgi:hypothetical protein